MTEKNTSFHAYVDNLIPSDRDNSCWCDVFSFITVVVPEKWLKDHVIGDNFASLEHFYSDYTFDDTDGLLQLALDDNVLVGVSMGKIELEDV